MASNVDSSINAELSDEVEAVNAIYGESTLRVTSSRGSDVFCLLNISGQAFSFELCFPASYPTEAPRLTGVDPLWMSPLETAKTQKAALQRALQDVFTPGQVCVFDSVEAMRAASLSQSAYPIETVNKTARSSVPSDKSSLMTPVEIGGLEQQRQCAACLDQYMAVDLAILQCDHSYCPDCLQNGFQACMDSKARFTCCGQWVPVAFLIQYCIFPAQVLTSYTDFLQELGAVAPVYCSNRKCGRFLLSARRIEVGLDNLRCPHCKKMTCAHCHRGGHAGICDDDSVANEFFEKLLKCGAQYCPSCHHMVQKSGGCNHMTCRCGCQWCWKCRTVRNQEYVSCKCGS